MKPQQRALLNTISYAEGTWQDGRVQYDMRFGGGRYNNNNPHPDQVITPANSNWSSAAHGAYQFMPGTWKGANKGANIPMTPEAQDAAALQLASWRGFDFNKSFNDQVELLAPEWASFPNARGVSNYNQPVKSKDELVSFYNQQMGLLGEGGGGMEGRGKLEGQPQLTKEKIDVPPVQTPAVKPMTPQAPAPGRGGQDNLRKAALATLTGNGGINPLQLVGPILSMFMGD